MSPTAVLGSGLLNSVPLSLAAVQSVSKPLPRTAVGVPTEISSSAMVLFAIFFLFRILIKKSVTFLLE